MRRQFPVAASIVLSPLLVLEKFNVTNTWNATFVEPAHGDVSLSLSFIAVTKERGKSQRINAVDFSLIEQDSVSDEG